MTPSVTRATAKIYAFPIGGRLGNERRETARPGIDATTIRPPASFVDCGYHEAALVESDRSRKV